MTISLNSLRNPQPPQPVESHLRRFIRRIILLGRAIATFRNFRKFLSLLTTKGTGKNTLITWDGLKIVLRENIWDARIIREIFLNKVYLLYFSKRDSLIVDIGAYIGDFSLYAAKYLNARVIAYEPTQESYELLKENIGINDLWDRIKPINKAVGPSNEITLNVVKEDNEIHVSSYWYPDAEKRVVQSVTLEEILDMNDLNKIDLLKIDCEGGEYDILLTAPDSVFSRVNNIVFEYHAIKDYQEKFAAVVDRLGNYYNLKRHGFIIHALRK